MAKHTHAGCYSWYLDVVVIADVGHQDEVHVAAMTWQIEHRALAHILAHIGHASRIDIESIADPLADRRNGNAAPPDDGHIPIEADFINDRPGLTLHLLERRARLLGIVLQNGSQLLAPKDVLLELLRIEILFEFVCHLRIELLVMEASLPGAMMFLKFLIYSAALGVFCSSCSLDSPSTVPDDVDCLTGFLSIALRFNCGNGKKRASVR